MLPKITSSKEFYKFADIVIGKLNTKAIKRFKKAQRQVSQAKFDELNVIKSVSDLYNDMAEDNMKAFVALAIAWYVYLTGKKKKDEDEEWWEDWLLSQILDVPNPVTQYIYSREVERKKERTTEAIIAGANKPQEFKKALRYWALQVATYVDYITDMVALKAYKEQGVKWVMWNTMEDEKVCAKCGPMDKKIYQIDKVPKKPHYRCRCWISPATHGPKKEQA